MLQDAFTKFRLSRVERKLKVLRIRQRDARQDLKELQNEREEGGMAPEEFEERAEDIRERKADLTEEISELREVKRDLEGSLEDASA